MHRWALLLFVAACSASEPIARIEVAQFPATESRQLDLVFLIDNSASTNEWQNGLAAEIPTLFADLADGTNLPALHVGIVTPDLGTTGSLAPDQPAPPIGSVGNGGCGDDGDGGVFRTTVVDGDTSMLSTALRLGSTGCGFEQHLHAIRRSLTVNRGFFRPDASLAVIALVDEDDCSVRDPRLFDPNAADLGALTSFRCARFGLVCDQALDGDGDKTHCRPDPASQLVEDPALTKTALDNMHGAARVTLSILGGPAGPVAVHQVSQGGAPSSALANVCGNADTAFPSSPAAGPSPRLAALADSFASRGKLHTICEPSPAPALASIAKRIERSLGVACLEGTAAVDDCIAHDVVGNARVELPRCPAAADCFDIVADAERCGGGMRVTIDRKTTPSAITYVEVACAPH